MKLILITLLAFAGSFAHADDEEDPTGPNSYAGTMARLHGYVERARDALLADLQKPYNDADPVAPDFDEVLFKKIILDEQKFNAALWNLQHPEIDPKNPEMNPYEPKPTKHQHHHQCLSSPSSS